MWPHCNQRWMMQQPHYHRSLLCSVRSHRLSSRVADCNCPGLRKVIFHCQKFSKLWDLGPLQKVAKESGGLKKELDFILCNNITRSANHKNHCICIVSIEHISQALPFFLYATIHMINMIVAFCITLWSSTYFSPFSQLKYFSQCCATSGMPLFSIYCWWNKQIFKYTQYTCTCYMYM